MIFKKNKLFSKGCKLQTHIFRELYSNCFELYIYDTRTNMHIGLKKWISARQRNSVDIDSDVAGMCVETNELEDWVDEKDDVHFKVFAAMFLNLTDLSVSTITHECLHAAMTHEREVIRYIGLYNSNDGTGEAPEERLAYTVGEYVEEICKICTKHKFTVKIIEDEKE